MERKVDMSGMEDETKGSAGETKSRSSLLSVSSNFTTATYRKAIESKQYGRVCYADPNELFPQATYYLHPDLKRPDYHQNDNQEPKKSKKRRSEDSFAKSDETSKEKKSDNDNKGTFLLFRELILFFYSESSTEKGPVETVDVLVKDDNSNPTTNNASEKQEKKKVTKTNDAATHELFEAEDSVDENDLDEEQAKPQDDMLTSFEWRGGVKTKKKIFFNQSKNDKKIFFNRKKKRNWRRKNLVPGMVSLSMAAIATNGEQRAGGAYYMISRTLGPAIGGAVGILYWFGMSVAVSMHIIGVVETMVDNFGRNVRLYGILLTSLCLACTTFGIGWVIKIQLVLVGVLVIAILSALIGSFINHNSARLPGGKGWSNGNL
ncbi:hypothetical protein RFI_00229, partial [Reticulomyxa filosa]